MSSEAFTLAWTEGQTLTLEQATERVLAALAPGAEARR